MSNNTQTTNDLPQKIGTLFIEIVKIVLLAGITVFLVRHFIFKPFYVKGKSMEPNFSAHDYLIVDQLTYQFRPPKRGEVVVFHPPVGDKEYYLKRVIGMPGERVRIKQGKVIVCELDCNVLKENYIDGTDLEEMGSYSVTLGKEQYFVLGDNRDNSSDSRIFGPIDRDAIVGKIWFRGFPFQRISDFERPNYKSLKQLKSN
jgi:signal peptidase I